jgi:hypothetical protein
MQAPVRWRSGERPEAPVDKHPDKAEHEEDVSFADAGTGPVSPQAPSHKTAKRSRGLSSADMEDPRALCCYVSENPGLRPGSNPEHCYQCHIGEDGG